MALYNISCNFSIHILFLLLLLLLYTELELDLGSLLLGGELDDGKRDGPLNLLFCTTCNLGVSEVLHSLKNGSDPLEIAAMITNLCINLGIASETLCENFIALAEVTNLLIMIMIIIIIMIMIIMIDK